VAVGALALVHSRPKRNSGRSLIGWFTTGGGAVFMVTPAKFMLAILAFIAMLIIIGAMVVLPDTGHYANIAH
jgi:hypothetical protein